jgi:Na+/melibiose symporter-like transporter
MATLWLVIVITSVICGTLANRYARKHQRDVFWWTFGGVVLNIFILALIFIIGNQSPRVKASLR